MTVTNSEQLNEAVAGAELVLVDFHATWCGPCKAIAPTLDKIDNDVATVIKIDIEEAPELAAEYAVRTVPTLVAFKNGEKVDQRVGGMPEGQMRAWLGGL